MPARVKEIGVIYDMPVDTLLLGASPPGLNHCFSASAVGYFQERLSSHTRINMGIGMRGDAFVQMQRNRRKAPLRSCIKVRATSGNGASNRGPIISEHQRNRPSVEANAQSTTTSSSPKLGVRVLGSPKPCHGSGHYIKNGTSCDGKEKKRVSFADTQGFSLHTVKYMDGPSSMPPKLRIHSLQDVIQDEEAKPTHPYTYVPDFEQPASNYLAFRGRLEQDNVCLENVMIKDNITVVGTVKVKNFAFEKAVMVRTSFDKWKSHKDIEATYVFPSQGAGGRDKYDTFSFNLDMPPNLGGRSFEFCICYTANNHQTFWDNNHGNNYKVVTEKEKDYVQHEERDSFQNLTGNYTWGEFSYWQATQENERPYW